MEKNRFHTLVDRKAKINSSSIIPNSSLDNGVSAMIKIFETTEKSIKMLVGGFESKLPHAEGYKEELEKVIKEKGVEVEILFSIQPNEESPVLQFLRQCRSSHKIRLGIVSESARQVLNNEIDNSGNPFYFAVSDSKRYRFEKDVKNHLAWICFNDEIKSRRLEQVFDQAYELSDPLN